MPDSARPRVWVNRILSFLTGGLIVLATMSFAVLTPVKSQNATLTAQLDEITNGAARLLGEAKAHIANQSYTNAAQSLETLFQKQPASQEAIDGRLLYAEVQATMLAASQRWDAAMLSVRSAWERTTAAKLRADADAVRQGVEAAIPDTLASQWEQSKDRIRRDWENGEL